MRMRVLSVLRLAALVGVMLLLPSVAMAQREYSPNFSVGVRGGATLSSMAFTPEVHQSMIQGLTMGVTARYTEEKYFGLIGEEAPQFEYSRTLTYVQIPLLTHIYFGSRKVKGFFNLGPEVGFLINDKITANFDYNKYDAIEGFPQGYRTNEQLRMEVQNTFDYGIAGGAGIEFFINRRNSIQLEGRYYFGLGNIFKATKRDYFASSRSTSIEVTLSYLFRVL